MAFAHRPLSEQELGPAAAKIVGEDAAAPMQLMAARGLAPLPPRDLVMVLYQFWAANRPKLGEEAAKTVAGLPDGVLAGALGDKNLPAGVLDFIARKLATKDKVLEQVVRHPKVDDETLVGMARICPEGITDLLAENQQRWLGCPAIVESLYQNPNCRMSVVHRMLELAVRQGVDLKLPNMEEIKMALGDGAAPDESRDSVFRVAAGSRVNEGHARLVDQFQRSGADDEIDYDPRDDGSGDEELDIEALLAMAPADDMSLPLQGEGEDQPQEQAEAAQESAPKGDRMSQISKLRPMEKMRLALMGSAFERSVLIRDANKAVSLSAIKSPRVKENEVVAYAANRTLSHDVVRYIARRRDWLKLYQVKLNLVLNPKTPMSAAMGFLAHLHAHDVRKVANSRNIPSVLAQAAKRKASARR